MITVIRTVTTATDIPAMDTGTMATVTDMGTMATVTGMGTATATIVNTALPPGREWLSFNADSPAPGYYHGSVDGVPGPQTRRAIRAYESDHGYADAG